MLGVSEFNHLFSYEVDILSGLLFLSSFFVLFLGFVVTH